MSIFNDFFHSGDIHKAQHDVQHNAQCEEARTQMTQASESVRKLRIVHYLNQYFGQIGGESAASTGVQVFEKPVGPGAGLLKALGDEAEIVATVVCGDNHIAENLADVTAQIVGIVKKYSPDLFFAGPAFGAGRYGVACGSLCSAVKKQLKIPAVTAMYELNPGVEIYKKDLYILKTGDNARSMGQDTARMVALAMKLKNGEPVGSPEEENYFRRGWARNTKSLKQSADRTIDMLLAKLKGEPFVTEVPMPKMDIVPAAPAVADISKATVALLTDGGLYPAGNPDKMPPLNPSVYHSYSMNGKNALAKGDYMVSHNGYDSSYILADPNRLVPLDAMRTLEAEGVVGHLHEAYLSTTGLMTTVANSQKIGREMAEYLKAHGVDAAILTST